MTTHDITLTAIFGLWVLYLIYAGLKNWSDKEFQGRAQQGFRCVCHLGAETYCHYCGD